MSVKSRPLNGQLAPLDRAILDSAASPVRVAFGILFLGWSWVSTVLIGGKLLAPLAPTEVAPGVPVSFAIALGFAVLVTAIEFVAAGRWPVVYALVLLICDAPFTTWQTYKWATAIIEPLTVIVPGGEPQVSMVGYIGIGVASAICGIIAAICGELLLFGRRR